MATGFTRERASSILAAQIKKSTYVALSTTTPTVTGGNFTEPPSSSGYIRAEFKSVDTTSPGQVSNGEYIFIFEALSDCGTITHVGLSDSETRGTDVFLMGELNPAISVGAGYVPLIRPHKLVIGLDKEVLDTYG